jgi:hypothetical protein
VTSRDERYNRTVGALTGKPPQFRRPSPRRSRLDELEARVVESPGCLDRITTELEAALAALMLVRRRGPS